MPRYLVTAKIPCGVSDNELRLAIRNLVRDWIWRRTATVEKLGPKVVKVERVK